MPRVSRISRKASSALAQPALHAPLIDTDELARRLRDPSLVIVDVRHDLANPDRSGAEAFAKAHLPGARFAQLDRDLSGHKSGRNGRHPLPTPEAAAAVFGRLGIDADKQVVAYDAGEGLFAARLWWMLRWVGHEQAAVLDGGFAKWERENRPVTADVREAMRTTFVPRNVRPTVNAAGVAASLPRHDLLLIDARAAERFRGDVEPIDAVAGHIPGALNRPYSRNFGPGGVFRSPRELRGEFDAMLHGKSTDAVVHYCGSGVSSCVNVLAMAIAGYPLTRLYPGSWSEWSADPKRPVAKGQV